MHCCYLLFSSKSLHRHRRREADALKPRQMCSSLLNQSPLTPGDLSATPIATPTSVNSLSLSPKKMYGIRITGLPERSTGYRVVQSNITKLFQTIDTFY